MTTGAHFQIHQAANATPSGLTDTARIDIYKSQTMHFVGDSSSGQLLPAWTILAWPDGSARVQPTNANTFDATYTPDTAGSYRAEFLVKDGIGINRKRFIFRVTRTSTGLVVDDGVAEPAFGEEVGEDNVGGNDRGYAKVFEVGMATQIPTIATVAVLRQRVGNRHRRVNLLGAVAVGDTGGGSMIWDASATAADDGGTIFQPGFGTGSALSTGRWVREYTGDLQSGWFGLLLDGTTPEDSTFSTAMAAARAAQKPLCLNGDTLKLTTTFTLQSHDEIRGAISVISVDSAIVIRRPTIKMATLDTDAFRGNNVHDVRLTGFRLLSAGTASGATSRAGVVLYGSTDQYGIEIKDCEFSGWARAICVWDYYQSGLIERCVFRNPITGPDGVTEGFTGTGHLVHNVYVDIVGPTSLPTRADAVRGWRIINNQWLGVPGDQQARGLNVGTSTCGFVISGNVVDGWQHNAFIFSGGAPAINDPGQANFIIQGHQVTNNQFLNLTFQSSRACWFFNGCRNCTFGPGNICYNVNGDNVEISNSPQCDVIGNKFIHGGYYAAESLGGVRYSSPAATNERGRVLWNSFYDMACYGVVSEGFTPQWEVAYNTFDKIGDTRADTGIQLRRVAIWADWGNTATSSRGSHFHHNEIRSCGEEGIYVGGDWSGIEIDHNRVRNVSMKPSGGGATQTKDAIFTTSLTVSATTRAPDDARVHHNTIEDLNTQTTRFAHKNLGALRVRVEKNEAFAIVTSPTSFNTDQADTRYDENRVASALPTWAAGYIKIVGAGLTAGYGVPNFGTQPVTTTGMATLGNVHCGGSDSYFSVGLAIGAATPPAHTLDLFGDIRISTNGIKIGGGSTTVLSWDANTWDSYLSAYNWRDVSSNTMMRIAGGTWSLDAANLTGWNMQGNFLGDPTHIGFFGHAPVGQQTVTGSRSSGAALSDLLTKLADLGLIIDGSSA